MKQTQSPARMRVIRTNQANLVASVPTLVSIAGPLAPDECVTHDDSISPRHVVIMGSDMNGEMLIKVELARDDVDEWLLHVLRHWLAVKHDVVQATALNLH
ncbi:MAG: hypothetical protein JWL61_5429 [Gemmatimonadetes bacterium]|nr:hypothetical protein [Gemmatimonadota bacterium]